MTGPEFPGIPYFAGMNQWYTKKLVKTSLHILWWLLFFTFPFLLQPVREDGQQHKFPDGNKFYFLHMANNLLQVALFYANVYIFIPKLVYQKKIFQYVMTLVLAVLVLLAFDRIFVSLFIPELHYRTWNFFAFHLPVFVFLVIASSAFRVISDRVEESQRIKERETETLKTELSFLRSQISPHFIFNVLNGMVSLARKKSDALEPSLIKLSQLMRYMLYETDENKVPLEKEVEYLRSYIDLQQQRFGRKVTINTGLELNENTYSIEPMLLVPFVENAFKHGTGLVTDATIDIYLRVTNGVLEFSVRNRFVEDAAAIKDKTSGIGLGNVQRRLNLLYDQNYSLLITKKEGWFTVLLHLNLH